MNILNISLLQFNPTWEDKTANFKKVEKLLNEVPSNSNLVLLPEMFLTGFSMNSKKIAEPMDRSMVTWMKSITQKSNFTLIGSLPIYDSGNYYNRLLYISPNEEVKWYDKKHLFRMGDEPENYSAGNERKIFSFNNWNICPLVCYDLRFPVWSRNTTLEYDILIYVSNWPKARIDAFISLLKARAIENQSYVIGINRVGVDGNGIDYNGNSVIFDAKGTYVSEPADNREQVINTTITLDSLTEFRKKFPVYLDADPFKLI